MSIKTNRSQQDLEASGDDELTLAVVTYVGGQSIYNATAMRQQGGWPANSPLNKGVGEIALLPSKQLGYWENHSDIEIAYDQRALAEALLDSNYLPPEVFGANVNITLRDRVLDTLGIDVKRNAEAYREAIADVAGEGVSPGRETDPHETRQSEFADAKRSTLQQAADAFGMGDVESAGRQALADYLADEDDDRVDATIRSIREGNGVPDGPDGSSGPGDSNDSGETSDGDLETLEGVGPETADDLRELGCETLADVADASVEDLTTIGGISESGAESLKTQAGGG